MVVRRTRTGPWPSPPQMLTLDVFLLKLTVNLSFSLDMAGVGEGGDLVVISARVKY